MSVAGGSCSCTEIGTNLDNLRERVLEKSSWAEQAPVVAPLCLSEKKKLFVESVLCVVSCRTDCLTVLIKLAGV